MRLLFLIEMVAARLHHSSGRRPPGVGRLVQTALLTLLAGLSVGCSREPFQHVQVSGTVTYEDGSPIPVEVLRLVFTPQAPPLDEKTYPRPGWAEVDADTGAFHSATTRKIGDGLVRGKHKVTLSGAGNAELPRSLVPPEYHDWAATPLEIDTEQQPFELKVRRPALSQKDGIAK